MLNLLSFPNIYDLASLVALVFGTAIFIRSRNPVWLVLVAISSVVLGGLIWFPQYIGVGIGVNFVTIAMYSYIVVFLVVPLMAALSGWRVFAISWFTFGLIGLVGFFWFISIIFRGYG
jgi:hypothetical protein